MKMNSQKNNLNVLSVCYLVILVLQIAGLVVGIFYEYINSYDSVTVLLQLLLGIKNFFNDNWIGLSAFSIILIPLNNLYYTITNIQNTSSAKHKSRNYSEYIFCIINILICCEVYNIEKIKNHIEFIKSNILSVCAIIAVVIGVFLLSNFLSKYIVAKKDRGGILDEIVSREEHPKNIEIHKENGKTETKKEFNDDLTKDQKEILKHPFSYAYENYKLYRARKKAIKYSNRLEIKKIKEDNLLKKTQQGKRRDDFSVAFILISIVVVVLLITVVCIGFIGDNDGVISEICKHLNIFLMNLTDDLELTEPNILNFIMAFGVIVLGFISYILVVYIFTYMWKAWWYLAKEFKGTNRNIEKFVKKMEKLFLNTVDAVVDLLMFIPDVLQNIIGIVYNDVQEDEDSEEEENNG